MGQKGDVDPVPSIVPGLHQQGRPPCQHGHLAFSGLNSDIQALNTKQLEAEGNSGKPPSMVEPSWMI